VHWNGLLVSIVGLVFIGVGVWLLRDKEGRRDIRADWRRVFFDNAPIYRLVAMLPGGFLVFMAVGLWAVVDGIYHVYRGHPMWPL
jgi:hypothetical protein